MRAFARLLASDLRYGLAAIAQRLLLTGLMAALGLFLSYVVIAARFPEGAQLSLGESMVCIWRGMLPYVPNQGEPFKFPIAWFALLVAAAFTAADYPFRDLGGMGARIIVACHSRWAWWLAKCCWVVAVAAAIWLATLAVAAIATLFAGGTWELSVRPGVAAALSSGRNEEISAALGMLSSGQAAQAAATQPIGIGPALFVIAIVLAAILLMQTTVSLLVHPIVGMAANIAVLFFSAYFRFWLLPGEYLMMARTDVLMRAGMHPATGVAIACALTAASIVIGGFMFNRKDILGRESEDR